MVVYVAALTSCVICAQGPEQQQVTPQRGVQVASPRVVSSQWREHKNYVLLFGTNHYENWPQLVNPIPDARAVAKVLSDDYGFEVELVTDASRAELLGVLKKYEKRHFDDGDELLIFFASHGSYDEDDGQGYIVTRDTKSEAADPYRETYESYDDLQRKIDAIPVKHLLLILDACFGGAFDRRIGESGARGNEQYGETPIQELFAHKMELTTRKYITSGGKVYVPDGTPGQHSPFVKNLLQALSSDGGRRGYLTFASIEASVQATKPEPYGGDWGKSDIGSDFFFISKNLAAHESAPETGEEREGLVGTVASSKIRHSIAVMGFKNLSPGSENSWISTAFSEELTTELWSGDIRPIPAGDVANLKMDLELGESSGFSRETLAKIRKILDTDWIVSGSYRTSTNLPERRIRVDLRVQDSRSGEIVAEDGEEGDLKDFSEVVKHVGTRLRDKLGVQVPSDEGQKSRSTPLPANTEVSRLYSQGVENLEHYNLLAARDLLVQAVGVDPNYALAHAALSDAWFQLGYDQSAKDEGRRSYDLSAKLPLEARLVIEGSYRQKTSEWGRAVEIYSELWRDYPDEIDYALELASVQTASGKGTDALATLEQLRNSLKSASDDPRVDFQEAIAAESLADAKRQQLAAAKSAQKALSQGSRLLLAKAYWQECTALFTLGDLKTAEDVCQKANQAADYSGGQQVKARSLTALSRILAAEGKTSEAMALDENILQMVRQIGSRKDVIGALMNLANLQAMEGHSAQAITNEREAVAIAREIEDKEQLIGLENNLSVDYTTLGEFEQARASCESALKTARQVGDQNGISTALQNLSTLSLLAGDLTVAEKETRQALTTAQNAQLQSLTASAYSNLGDIQAARGELEAARNSYENALKLFSDTSDQVDVARTELSLAKLALEEEKFGEAEKLCRHAVEEFQSEKLRDYEVDARNTLVRILAAQGNLDAAKQEMQGASNIEVEDCVIRIARAITAADLKARSGDTEAARNELEALLEQSKGKRLVGLQLEVRLALAQMRGSGDRNSRGVVLTSLREDAKNSGYLLIASKAQRLQIP
jgi:tetratricopeptide (TPR) repeat protein/TolB-like protein